MYHYRNPLSEPSPIWKCIIPGGDALTVFLKQSGGNPNEVLDSMQSAAYLAFLTLDEVEAKFELQNVGGLPVHILAAQSSCGCAEPKVHPTTIVPGNVGYVEVRALPRQVGEKLATITLRTDSPSTPEVLLRVRIIGKRASPFLLQAGGQLAYMGDLSRSDTRQITAINIESESSHSKPPIVKTDLSFLEIGPPILKEKPYTGAGTVQREYVYQVNLSADPPLGDFSGEVLVVDPWDPLHVERVLVHGQSLPPLRALPSRIILRVDKTSNNRDIKAEFLILSKDPAPDLLVEAEGGGELPVTVSRLTSREDGRLVSFAVSLKPGPIEEAEFNIIVRRPSRSIDRLVIPVAVRTEDGR
jgi:uncharacterized protein DUF1573